MRQKAHITALIAGKHAAVHRLVHILHKDGKRTCAHNRAQTKRPRYGCRQRRLGNDVIPRGFGLHHRHLRHVGVHQHARPLLTATARVGKPTVRHEAIGGRCAEQKPCRRAVGGRYGGFVDKILAVRLKQTDRMVVERRASDVIPRQRIAAVGRCRPRSFGKASKFQRHEGSERFLLRLADAQRQVLKAGGRIVAHNAHVAAAVVRQIRVVHGQIALPDVHAQVVVGVDTHAHGHRPVHDTRRQRQPP